MVFKTNENFKKMGSYYIKVSFPVSDKLLLESRLQLDKDHTEMWRLDEKLSLKLLDKKDISFELKKKGFFGADTLDTKSFKLLGLSQKCDFEKEVAFKGLQ